MHFRDLRSVGFYYFIGARSAVTGVEAKCTNKGKDKRRMTLFFFILTLCNKEVTCLKAPSLVWGVLCTGVSGGGRG